jgi:hypothetical protein
MVRATMIAAAAVVAGNLAAGTPAQAIEWPWCADLFEGRGGGTATNCGFASFRQCESYISGISGWCYRNPRYPEQRPPRRTDGRR